MVARVDCVAKKGRALYHVFLAKTTPYTNPAPLMPVSIKSPQEQEKMRTAGRLAGEVLDMIGEHVQAGVTTDELDRICHDYIVGVQRTIPANLNYRGFPKTICTSVNHVVCHGIPNDKRLKSGDVFEVLASKEDAKKIRSV